MRIPFGPVSGVLLLCLSCPTASAAPLFINEFHYDNHGTDAAEFVEIAGPSGTRLDGWVLALYNGTTGLQYGMRVLSGLLVDDTGTGFGFHQVSFPSNGLQNGPADGLALVAPSGVVDEFLSYEGVLMATGGPLLGMVSLDVGVNEGNATPLGASLQRVGKGATAADFAWRAFTSATPGSLNHQQQLARSGMKLNIPPSWPLCLTGLLWLGRRRGFRPHGSAPAVSGSRGRCRARAPEPRRPREPAARY